MRWKSVIAVLQDLVSRIRRAEVRKTRIWARTASEAKIVLYIWVSAWSWVELPAGAADRSVSFRIRRKGGGVERGIITDVQE